MSVPVSRAIEHSDVTERLVRCALDSNLSDISTTGLDILKRMLLDTFGVALAASHHPVGRMITKHAGAQASSAEAGVLGSPVRTSAAAAAQANGTLANAIDYDDGNHVVTCVLPAALAMAEKTGASGADFLMAFAVSLEIGTRLKDLVDGARKDGGGPTHRGWWHVSLTGPIAAAAAAARLLRLDHQTAAMALAISTTSSGGFRRNMGTMAKALHSGNSARAGVEAALLAQDGFTGDPQAIEAPLGFARAVCAPEEPDWAALDRLGPPFFFERASLAKTKPYPCCTPIQPVLDAALALRAEHGLTANEIVSVDADLHRFSLFRHEASDVDAVGFCGSFLLAAALVRGRMGLDETGEDGVRDPTIHAMMQRIAHTKSDPERVVISTRDGRQFSKTVGPIRRLTTLEEVVRKFDECASHAIPRNNIATLREAILNVEREPDLQRIMQLAAGA